MKSSNGNIRFSLVKLDNHVMIQFDHLDKSIELSKREMFYSGQKNGITIQLPKSKLNWDFKIFVTGSKNRIAMTRKISRRFITLNLNPNKEIVNLVPSYGDFNNVGRIYNNRDFGTKKVITKNEEVLSLQFKDNIERDSFCEAFLIFMKDMSNYISIYKETEYEVH